LQIHPVDVRDLHKTTYCPARVVNQSVLIL
jgi:hypothetical protein